MGRGGRVVKSAGPVTERSLVRAPLAAMLSRYSIEAKLYALTHASGRLSLLPFPGDGK